MTWRQSTGRDVCNTRRHPIAEGAPVYVGTHATWCEEHAASDLGKALGDGQEVPAKLPVATGLAGLRELALKFAPKVRANWGERE